MIVKALGTGAATMGAAAVVAAAAIGTTSVAANAPADVTAPVQLAVFGVPLPLDPAADLPTADQVVGVLSALMDPSVSFGDKGGLVGGGISPTETGVADHKMQQAATEGDLPLSFSAANIQPGSPAGLVTSDVTISGPHTAPQTLNLTFVNQDGWKLLHKSALLLLKSL